MLEPRTILGEAVNVVTDYLSLLVLTLPIAIIGRNFHLQYESFFRCVEHITHHKKAPLAASSSLCIVAGGLAPSLAILPTGL